MIDVGDIIAIEGTSWLSRSIIEKTRRKGDEQASHVGLITAVTPYYQVTEALWHVQTRPLSVSVSTARRAWCLSLNALGSEQRAGIAWKALQYQGRDYGYLDIFWQAMDSLFGTRWFTEHLALRHWPICSMLDDVAYEAVGIHLTSIPDRSITPNDVLSAALADPKNWTVKQIK